MNVKRNAILEVARRYDYDARHAHQVECLAGTLFMELEALHHLGYEDRKLLEYAAILHDIGYYLSSQGHHRHALQMILMEPLPEFSRQEKLVLANLARYHRKSLPAAHHTAYNILSDEDRRRVDLLAPLLRLADALDRSRQEGVQELFCDIGPDVVIFCIGSDRDLPEEMAAVSRKADMFRQVYGREATIRIAAPRLPRTPTPTAIT